MKKAANSTPDRLLKVERELRGWSQKYVADRIGADHYYLSPWEHGTASPSPIGVKLTWGQSGQQAVGRTQASGTLGNRTARADTRQHQANRTS